jgi:hypothetical protein
MDYNTPLWQSLLTYHVFDRVPSRIAHIRMISRFISKVEASASRLKLKPSRHSPQPNTQHMQNVQCNSIIYKPLAQ